MQCKSKFLKLKFVVNNNFDLHFTVDIQIAQIMYVNYVNMSGYYINLSVELINVPLLKAEKKRCNEVLNMADQGAVILVIVG